MQFIRDVRADYAIRPVESIVFQGDATAILRQLPDNFFRCCVTSPPYWGLRDYAAEGQIGAEPRPDDYIEHLVEVFEGVKRVLTVDGTVWLNIGDSYTSGNRVYYSPLKMKPSLFPFQMGSAKWRLPLQFITMTQF